MDIPSSWTSAKTDSKKLYFNIFPKISSIKPLNAS